MSNAARKARKRAGIRHSKPRKRPTGTRPGKPVGLGLVSAAEILAALLVRGQVR